MSGEVEFWEKPKAAKIYMLAGWRQWADGGSVSSGLPHYLIQLLRAKQIGVIHSGGFYLFQFPGTHDLLRPVVKFNQGFPEALEIKGNEFYYTGDDQRGLVIFLGDEPQLDVEIYVSAFLQAARILKVQRIIGFGGVYGEVPYDKERSVSCNYSLPRLKMEVEKLAVNLSEYHGGASIGSYICKRASEQEMEYIGLYSFAPTYSFPTTAQTESTISIENDFMSWLGIMKRVNYMLKLNIDLSDLEKKSRQMIEAINTKVEELESSLPQLGVREFLKRVSNEFTETPFSPLDDIWEDEIKRVLDKFDPEAE